MKLSQTCYIILPTILICITATFSYFYFFSFQKHPSSPFDLGIDPKDNLTHEDFIRIQAILHAKHDDLEKLVHQLYPTDRIGYASPNDYIGRCLRGVKQVLIDPKQEWFPEVKLEKINNGGDCCIVTSVPYIKQYPELARSKTEQLRKVGFNGYYLYFVGGYPNPTGTEIQYVAVPYAIKIFAMMEAQKKGFNKVLWVDSAAMPLRDPSPLFEWLEKNGAFIHGWDAPKHFWTYLIPETRQLLKELTGTDVLKTFYINSVVFGLKMDDKLATSFIDQYFQMLKLGTPFLSCFPEECIFMAIYGQKKFKKKWKHHHIPNVLKYLESEVDDTLERIEKARSNGVYFYQMRH